MNGYNIYVCYIHIELCIVHVLLFIDVYRICIGVYRDSICAEICRYKQICIDCIDMFCVCRHVGLCHHEAFAPRRRCSDRGGGSDGRRSQGSECVGDVEMP